jgi:hypothetical protein
MKKGSSGRKWKSGGENFSRKQTGNLLIEKKRDYRYETSDLSSVTPPNS